MTATTTTTTTNDADAITGRAVRAGPDVEWTTHEGCLFVMGGGEVLRYDFLSVIIIFLLRVR